LLAESDLLAFPTKYSGETLPVLLLEAMAFGLPVVTTTWRDVHKLLPGMYPGVTDPGNVDGLARLLVDASGWDHFENLRSHFSAHYTLESHLRRMTEAILASEEKS
jgi:glycosyltransferase involved in cell wall biosynthesis